MPPRHHYWTIILEGKPTAFRAHTQEELMPTLRQLQARHPDAVLKWFARGRLWDTQEQERAAAMARRRPRTPAGDRRTRDWRPGGEHKDPRDRFKVPRDEKRRRFAQNLRRDRPVPLEAGERPPHANRPAPFTRRPRPDRPPQFDRPPRPGSGTKPPGRRDEERERKESPWKRDGARPSGKPRGDRRPGDSKDQRAGGASGQRRFVPRPPRSPRPPGGRKPGGGGKHGGGGHGQ